MAKQNHVGLNDQEVLKSREEFGSNQVTTKAPETFMQKFWGTFKGDPIIKILVIALIVQVGLFFFDLVHWYEPAGITIAVLLATFFGTLSEFSSEKEFQRIQEEAAKIKCKVYRNGKLVEILISEIVQGDLIQVQTGDKIPADCIIVEGALDVNQASLNGETKTAKKIVAYEGFDYTSNKDDVEDSVLLNPYKLFRETVVQDGEAVLKVMAVGDNTLVGKKDDDEEEELPSPLTLKLSELANKISLFGYIGGAAIAVALMVHNIILSGDPSAYLSLSNGAVVLTDFVNSVVWAVIIIVMAVPEGLPMMTALVLGLNVKKLLRDQILVRKPIGIETAGSLQILFSDKTGTFTKGKPELVKVLDANLVEYSSPNTMADNYKEIFELSLTNNTSSTISVDPKTQKKVVIGGNITEIALADYVIEKQIPIAEVEVKDTIAFKSANKFSAMQIEKDGKNITLVKGAAERLVEGCTHYLDRNGEKRLLTDSMKENLNKHSDILASMSMRLLAFAYKEEEIPQDHNNFYIQDCVFVSLLGIRDDLRETTKPSIEQMHRAGVQVVMVTGDRKETAVAIAKEAGLITKETDIVLTTKDMAEKTDDELRELLPNLRVVARAVPQDKLRLVKIAQSLNLVTGMTGDGANDAPALAKADVGFAMGSGTEVAKEASEIVILDDNFKSIAKTCLYGRTIYNSIQKFINFQLTVNVSAVAISLIGPFLGIEPLKVTQILWINLIMDTLAALAFGGEPALDKFMDEKPKSRDEKIVTKNMWSAILTGGAFVFVTSLMFFFWQPIVKVFRPSETMNYLYTGYFTFFVFLNVFNMFNARVKGTNLLAGIKDNKGFLNVAAVIVVVQMVLTYFGGDILRAYGLTIEELLFSICFAFLIIPCDIIRKKIQKIED